MNTLLFAGYKSGNAMNRPVILVLLLGLLLAGCGASAGQLHWQPALMLASGSPVGTVPRIPAHPATTAECPEAPAPTRAGSSLDSDGDQQASTTSSGEEDSGGGGGMTMSSENAEEDESAGWE
jgi:hypothetical protein